MKFLTVITFQFIFVACAFSQELEKLNSAVYSWVDLPVEKTESGARRQIFEGYTHTLAYFEMHVTTINPGTAPHQSHVHDEMEELIIIKEGDLEINLNGKNKVLGPGSVVLAVPGDNHGIWNNGRSEASYYILRWKVDGPMNPERSKQAGGSQYYNWKDIPVETTEKGFHRQMMKRPTALLQELEMHVTTLKEGNSSHGEHVHDSEEMVIITKGEVEKSIDGKLYRLGPGSTILLVDGVPHGIRNVGAGTCEYFAFRWE
jgi:quercetin dioxygenase-like cupin family protein